MSNKSVVSGHYLGIGYERLGHAEFADQWIYLDPDGPWLMREGERLRQEQEHLAVEDVRVARGVARGDPAAVRRLAAQLAYWRDLDLAHTSGVTPEVHAEIRRLRVRRGEPADQ